MISNYGAEESRIASMVGKESEMTIPRWRAGSSLGLSYRTEDYGCSTSDCTGPLLVLTLENENGMVQLLL